MTPNDIIMFDDIIVNSGSAQFGTEVYMGKLI